MSDHGAATQCMLAQVLAASEAEIVASALKDQIANRKSGRALLKQSELQEQTAEFVRLLRDATQRGDLEDLAAPEWEGLKEMLAALSRSRALQGSSPSDTATFVLAFKRPLFQLLLDVHARDAAAPGGKARGSITETTALLGAGVHAFLGAPEDGLIALVDVLSGQRRPTRGQVRVVGVDPASTPSIRARIGALGPDPRLPPAPTVGDAVRLALQARGERVPRIDAVLDPFGLGALHARPPRTLSFAEARAVELALALTTPAPLLLVLYEPLADVALPAPERVRLLLRDLARAGAGARRTHGGEVATEVDVAAGRDGRSHGAVRLPRRRRHRGQRRLQRAHRRLGQGHQQAGGQRDGGAGTHPPRPDRRSCAHSRPPTGSLATRLPNPVDDRPHRGLTSPSVMTHGIVDQPNG